ncbi:Uncharacterised protein [Neisseria weaveri]|nr:Uncharacterised protein [Neisseria weaveri]
MGPTHASGRTPEEIKLLKLLKAILNLDGLIYSVNLFSPVKLIIELFEVSGVSLTFESV